MELETFCALSNPCINVSSNVPQEMYLLAGAAAPLGHVGQSPTKSNHPPHKVVLPFNYRNFLFTKLAVL